MVGRARRARHRRPTAARDNPADPRLRVVQRHAGRPRPLRRRPQRHRPADVQLQLLQGHAAARRPRRRRSSAARSTPRTRPRRPTQPPNTLRVASFNVENYFPVGKENDGHVITPAEYNETTDAIVQRDPQAASSEPDVIAVQEVAVFADGANALTGLAAALGNYTPLHRHQQRRPRRSRRASWSRTATTAANGEVHRRGRVGEPVGQRHRVRPAPGPAVRPRAVQARDQEGRSRADGAQQPLRLAVAPERVPHLARRTTCASRRPTLQAAGKNVLVAGDLNDFEFSDDARARSTQGGTLDEPVEQGARRPGATRTSSTATCRRSTTSWSPPGLDSRVSGHALHPPRQRRVRALRCTAQPARARPTRQRASPTTTRRSRRSRSQRASTSAGRRHRHRAGDAGADARRPRHRSARSARRRRATTRRR